MRLSCGHAVAAAAFPGEAEALRTLLLDFGCSEVTCVGDGLSALKLAQVRLTDVIVADAVLPVLDGAALAKRILTVPLTVYPAVVLLAVPGMCPRTGCALEKPITPEKLLEALESMRLDRRGVPVQKRELAERVLNSVGVPRHCGRDYLLRAIELAWLDGRLVKSLTTKLYPAVARAFGVNARQAERAMRHVIDVAWRSGELEAQYKLFGDTLDAKRGGPTCGEMIAQIADILRWEGKA